MTPQDKINALAVEQRNNTEALTSKTMEAIHKELVVDMPKAVLPEDVFVRYFLDYFKQPTVESHLLYKWLELSGGPYNEVDIIDNNGNVIITVPGVYSKPLVDSDGMADYNFADIAARYSLEGRITASKASAFLNTALSGVSDNVKSESMSQIMRWQAVVNKYSEGGEDVDSVEDIAQPKEAVDVGIFDI